MAPVLRPYQNKGVEEIRNAMAANRRVLFVLPTGGGKTMTFSFITHAAIQKGKRVYVVVHRAEILDQICAALRQFNVPHGRIQPGKTPTDDLVQVAMIGTIVRRLDRLPAPDMIVIDECHHAITGSYGTLMDAYPRARVLGVTATPERLDGRGLGETFDAMIQGPSTRWLIDNGFLADFDYYAPPVMADLSSVKTRLGDYAIDDLEAAMSKPTITGDALAHYKRFLSGRPAIAFCVTVDHAKSVAECFNAAGVPAASIDGSMSHGERKAIVDGLKTGKISVMTSCDLISEGFDVPAVSGAILLRPTKSLGLYLQQIGRALRLKPDGSKAVILDHVSNCRHGTPKTERKWSLDSKKRKGDSAGVRQCKSCFKAFDHAEFQELKTSGVGCGEVQDGCIFVEKPRDQTASVGREVEHIDGELVALTESPEWAGGINVMLAKGQDWKAMMAKADTVGKLQDIAKIRGYSGRWPFFIMKQRGQHV